MRAVLLISLLVLVLCPPAASAGEPSSVNTRAGEHVDDATLTARVKAALVDDQATKAPQIKVETQDGVVQLSGFVDSEEIKQAALTRASSVTGVQEVRDGLSVRESDRTPRQAADDTVIAAKVKADLADNEGIESASDVHVTVNNGIVQLSGFVATVDEKTRAADIASNVSGVKDVRNEIAAAQK
jgi:hyperosmotically inducible protein